MPTANQSTINQFCLIGKATEFEVKKTKTANGTCALNVRGQVAIGDRVRVRFRKYVPQYTKSGAERKDYQPLLALANEVQTISKVGKENATLMEITGELRTNDYVNPQGQLVEALSNEVAFIHLNPTDPEKAEFTIQGMIQSITDEGDGCRVLIYALDFKGDVVPFKFYVPSELADALRSSYYEQQTAVFHTEYKALATEQVETGGIGVQFSTGKTRYDYILSGATAAVDPGMPNSIDPEVVKEGLARRKAHLAELEERGYQGNRNTASSAVPQGIGVAPSGATYSFDDDEEF